MSLTWIPVKLTVDQNVLLWIGIWFLLCLIYKFIILRPRMSGKMRRRPKGRPTLRSPTPERMSGEIGNLFDKIGEGATDPTVQALSSGFSQFSRSQLNAIPDDRLELFRPMIGLLKGALNSSRDDPENEK